MSNKTKKHYYKNTLIAEVNVTTSTNAVQFSRIKTQNKNKN